MINSFVFALTALSAITGRTCVNPTNLNLSENNFDVVFNYSNNSANDISSIQELYSTHGVNLYSLFRFNDGTYVVLDKGMNSIIESGQIEKSIYNALAPNNFIVIDNDNHYVFNRTSSTFISIENGKQLEKGYHSKHEEYTYHYYPCISTDYPNAHYINNVFYFDNLNGHYGYNNSGDCGIIAAQILLGYYDTFENDLIVQECFDNDGECDINTNQLSSWEQSPSTDTHLSTSTDGFRNYLVNKCISVNSINPQLDGMDEYDVKRLINAHLDDMGVSATLHFHTSHLSFLDDIEDAINDNRPVIATLPDHFVVIFGYDSEYFYADTGWGFTARFLKSDFDFWNSTCGMIDLQVNQHKHSNNYYNTYSHNLYCGCGMLSAHRLDMDPADWDFEERYYFYSQTCNHYEDGVSFSSSRLRTGYIQSSVINLSPRRSGAGIARFDVLMPLREIERIRVELAWWGPNEHQDDGNAYIMYHEAGENEYGWIQEYSNISNFNLNTSHTSLKCCIIDFPLECDGISFYLTNQSVGDRNLGRLSIGKMQIDYL